jgi:DNA topoisomerase IB
MMFDYIAKAGKHRTITISDREVLPTVRALARQDNGLEPLFCYEHGDTWHVLHPHQVNDYIADRSGGHFTAKEFRTWNATMLMALVLANYESEGRLPSIPAVPTMLPAPPEAENAVAAWLAASGDPPDLGGEADDHQAD